MIYVITKVENDRVAKYIRVDTVEEAQDELDRVLPDWPDAFILVTPEERPSHLKVNPDGSVVVEPPTPPKKVKSSTELLLEELGFNEADIQAAKERVKLRQGN